MILIVTANARPPIEMSYPSSLTGCFALPMQPCAMSDLFVPHVHYVPQASLELQCVTQTYERGCKKRTLIGWLQIKKLCTANPTESAKLQAALAAAPNDFKYDKHYICSSLGWPTPPDAPPAAAAAAQPPPLPPARPPKLVPVASWQDFEGPVRGVFVDRGNSQVVAATGKGLVSLHTYDGTKISRSAALPCPRISP